VKEREKKRKRKPEKSRIIVTIPKLMPLVKPTLSDTNKERHFVRST
jgi:hypothetical protein